MTQVCQATQTRAHDTTCFEGITLQHMYMRNDVGIVCSKQSQFHPCMLLAPLPVLVPPHPQDHLAATLSVDASGHETTNGMAQTLKVGLPYFANRPQARRTNQDAATCARRIGPENHRHEAWNIQVTVNGRPLAYSPLLGLARYAWNYFAHRCVPL